MNGIKTKEIKKDIITGVGIAGGTAIGASVENAINTTEAAITKSPDPQILNATIEESNDIHSETEVIPEVVYHSTELLSDNHESNYTQPQRPHSLHSSKPIILSQDSEEVGNMAEVETIPDAVIANIEDPESDEDIVIVSVESEDNEEIIVNVENTSLEAHNDDIMVEGNTTEPDYAEIKDNYFTTGTNMISDEYIPDYVNDANIDLFTDNNI